MKLPPPNDRGSRPQGSSTISLSFLCCLFSFLLGIQIGVNSSIARCSDTADTSSRPLRPVCEPCSSRLSQPVQRKDATSFPPSTLERVVYDYATTSREDFLEKFDLGVPKDATTEGAEDVLILYNSNRSLPSRLKLEGGEAVQNHNHYLESAVEATEHCQSVKVVLVDPIQRSRKDVAQCLALVPQWSSPYIYKFMRLPDDQGDWHGKGRLDNNLPLRYVSRTHKSSGRHHATVPNLERHTLPSLRALSDYTQELPHAQQRLRSLLNNTDTHDPMIVMTVNKGQSELLVNFVCSATSRDLPLHRVILFATDQYTYSLCQDLRLPYCYHDPTLFGDIPQEAAEYFGDNTFMKVMKAKVYSVHLILTLGYSVLFMDVDVVWYKNPLDYYRTIMVKEQRDLVFQNDGAKTLQYAPYSPNSGFYFVRHSPKTMFLFGELLKMGDTISLYHSHQHALSQLLNEHISWTGLRVKVHNTGFDNPFPGGFEFSRRHLYMKELLGGAHTNQDPYIFHMCWTESKEYKIKFFQQMGLWYVIDGYKNGSCTGIGCCTKKPEVRCHFRDMPSKIPCNDSPPLDEEDPGKSFW